MLLKEAQATPDSPADIATIPSLTLKDLDPNQAEYSTEVSLEQGATVMRHVLPTNGILYVNVGLDLTQLNASELPLISLFSK
jgi:presequence protease